MILQVLADAGQGVNQRNIELAQQFRAADAGALQDLRRSDGARASSTFYWRWRLTAPCCRLQPLDADGAFAGKNNAIGQRMGANGQIGSRARLVEITARGTGAASLRRHGTIHGAKPFLLVAVKIVGARVAGLYAGFNHRVEQRIVALLWRGDADRAVAAVVVVGANIAGFRLR